MTREEAKERIRWHIDRETSDESNEELINEIFEDFDRQLEVNTEQIQAMRIAIDRAGFELKEIEGGYVLCKM